MPQEQESAVETVARRLRSAELPASDREIARIASVYALVREGINLLHAAEEARDEESALIFNAAYQSAPWEDS